MSPNKKSDLCVQIAYLANYMPLLVEALLAALVPLFVMVLLTVLICAFSCDGTFDGIKK